MRICEYGCGREAKYQFKNGKWCCEDNWNKCPELRRKNSTKNQGRNRSNETIEKHRQSLLGVTLDMRFGVEGSKEIRNEMSKIRKGKTYEELFGAEKANIMKEEKRIRFLGKNNPMYGKSRVVPPEEREAIRKRMKDKVVSLETRKKISISNTNRKMSSEERFNRSISNRYSISKIKKKYPTFSKIEEMCYDPERTGEKVIQIHCKNHNCPNSKEKGGWFTPTRSALLIRIYQIENKNGNDSSYLYCSEKCKQECRLYNKSAATLIKEDQIRAGHIPEEQYTYEEYQTWRQEVLQRANNKCEYCGEKAEHCHHIKPQKLEPIFSLDPDYGVACCKNCHYKYGHPTGTECSTGALAQRIC